MRGSVTPAWRMRPLGEAGAVEGAGSFAAERVGRADHGAGRREGAAATAAAARGPGLAEGHVRRQAERAERLGAGHAVDAEAVRGLEAPDRGAGDRAVLAVGGHAERALERGGGRPAGTAAAGAARAERATGDRADHAVDEQAVGTLERPHRAPRLAAEDPVRGDPQRALGGRDGRALAADLQVAGADRARRDRLLRLGDWPAGTISVAAISAVGTAHFFRFARRAAAASRRRRERFSDRSHTSGLPRSRLPGGSAKIAQPSPLIRGS